MQNAKTENQKKEMEWNGQANEDAIKRVTDFMKEDDEAFFHRTIQGLTGEEIEEFVKECPEFLPFWEKEKKKQKENNRG